MNDTGNRARKTFDSLRGKRFRGVWEQRKTEERDFAFFALAENGARTKKQKDLLALFIAL